jgi:uroporphyrinogen decarboxylase
VSLKKCREIFNKRIAFAGNVNPAGVMLKETPEGVAKASRECIVDAGSEPGFLLMPGCDIPPATPADNIRALTRTGREYLFNGAT